MPLWPRSPPARPSRNSGYLLPGAAYLSPRIIWKPIPRPTVEFELSARDIPEIDGLMRGHGAVEILLVDA